MRIQKGVFSSQFRTAFRQLQFAGKFTTTDLRHYGGVAAVVAGAGMPYLTHKAIEAAQFDYFRKTLERHPEKLESQFKPGPAGDTALHERLRWLVKSGDVALLRKAMEQKRVRELDLDQGEHIGVSWQGKPKNNLVDKALKHLKSPPVLEETLKILVGHPKYNPDSEYEYVPHSRFNNGTERTLMFWAIEQKKPELVRALLAHPHMEEYVVDNALAGETEFSRVLKRSRARQINRMIAGWRHEQDLAFTLGQNFQKYRVPSLSIARQEAHAAYRDAWELRRKLVASPYDERLRKTTEKACAEADRLQKTAQHFERFYGMGELRVRQEASVCKSGVLQKTAQAFAEKGRVRLIPELMRLSQKRPSARQQQYLVDLAPDESKKQELATALTNDALRRLREPGLNGPMLESALGSLSLGAAPTNSMDLVDLINLHRDPNAASKRKKGMMARLFR